MASTDKLKFHYLIELARGQRVSIVDVPSIHLSLRSHKLLNRGMINWIASRKTMRLAK